MFSNLSNRKKQVFLRLLVSYIIVLLIPVVIGTIIYNNALRIIENIDNPAIKKANMFSIIRQENSLCNIAKKLNLKLIRIF
jgi:hypothetical protein